MNAEMLRLYLLKKGLRESTIKTRLRLAKYLLSQIQPFNKAVVCDFLATLKTRGCTNGYINSVIATIRIICDCDSLEWGKSVKYWVNRRTEKQTLSETEIRQFLSLNIYHQTESYPKWRMFWLLVASCGFRCGEVATLQTNEINLADRSIRLTQTKTTARTVPIPDSIYAEFERYLKNKNGYLFTRRGVPISRSGWSLDFKNRLKRMGITKTVTPHSLRHSFITHLLSDGQVPIFDVQQIVGHKDVKTTEIYYHANIKTLRKAINKNPLFLDSMPADKKLQVFKEAVREAIEALKLNDDKRIKVELLEKDGSFEVKVKLTKDK